MLVYVLSIDGKPLMPCKAAKARKLLKQGRAKVVKRTPFTIQLNFDCENQVQDVKLGVDTGYKHVGLSAVSSDKELFRSEVELRTDIQKLLSEKRQYRRTRRNRLWYRKARFLNRGIKAGWLAPSVEHRLNEHVKAVDFVKSILPVSEITVEAAVFDIQKIKNPDITGTDYQNGDQKDFWNVREYVLYRDGHKCQACNGKSKDKVLNVHHIESRQTGGDRPDNLITLCESCHKAYHKGKIELKVKKHKAFKAETIMSILRWKIVNKLRELGNAVSITYGYLTKSSRIALKLEKSHANDAFCIAGGSGQERTDNNYFIKYVRKCNRSLFKANLLKGGKRKVNTIKQAFGFHRFDKVLYGKIECFIYSLRSSGYFDLRLLTGEKINASVKYIKLRLIETFKTRRIALLPCMGVSEL
ncbi:MAG: HNH endonuclease [Candidatus Acidulodesulfobacterium acidiphilum]|uniref:HNH endonuclease n=1 Tax=Candidatus Acidulodesulfobacterium acidiphilum TaxID=2597224 RepID=A0A520XGF5_9DELT|nr:MAG: HNH endonuclease [Candidatus Acidulodesulfobacterium acidiphilum]